jgi:hypothetical protein
LELDLFIIAEQELPLFNTPGAGGMALSRYRRRGSDLSSFAAKWRAQVFDSVNDAFHRKRGAKRL